VGLFIYLWKARANLFLLGHLGRTDRSLPVLKRSLDGHERLHGSAISICHLWDFCALVGGGGGRILIFVDSLAASRPLRLGTLVTGGKPFLVFLAAGEIVARKSRFGATISLF